MFTYSPYIHLALDDDDIADIEDSIREQQEEDYYRMNILAEEDAEIAAEEAEYLNKTRNGHGHEEDPFSRPKLEGYEGLKTFRRIKGRSQKMSVDDWIKAQDNTKFNRKHGYVKARRLEGKVCDPTVLYGLRSKGLSPFLNNPFVEYVVRTEGITLESAVNKMDYHMVNGKPYIRFVGDQTADEYKWASGYWLHKDENQREAEIVRSQGKVRLFQGGPINTIVSVYGYVGMLLDYQNHKHFLNSRDRHRDRYFWSSRYKVKSREEILARTRAMTGGQPVVIDFKGLERGDYTHLETQGVLNATQYVAEVVKRQAFIDYIPKIEAHETLKEEAKSRRISQLNGPNGERTHKDCVYETMLTVHLMGNHKEGVYPVLTLSNDHWCMTSKGVWRHLIATNLEYPRDYIVHAESKSVDNVWYVFTELTPNSIVQLQMDWYTCAVHYQAMATVHDTSPLEMQRVTSNGWLEYQHHKCNVDISPASNRSVYDTFMMLHDYPNYRWDICDEPERIGESVTETPVDYRTTPVDDTNWFDQYVADTQAYGGDRTISARLYGPGYSSDDSGDGPKVHVEFCACQRCSKALHTHRLGHDVEKKKSQNAKNAESRVANTTKKTKEAEGHIVDIWKYHTLCMYGCGLVAHQHVKNRKERMAMSATFCTKCVDREAPSELLGIEIDVLRSMIIQDPAYGADLTDLPTYQDLMVGYKADYGEPVNALDDPNADEDAEYVELQTPLGKSSTKRAGSGKVVRAVAPVKGRGMAIVTRRVMPEDPQIHDLYDITPANSGYAVDTFNITAGPRGGTTIQGNDDITDIAEDQAEPEDETEKGTPELINQAEVDAITSRLNTLERQYHDAVGDANRLTAVNNALIQEADRAQEIIDAMSDELDETNGVGLNSMSIIAMTEALAANRDMQIQMERMQQLISEIEGRAASDKDQSETLFTHNMALSSINADLQHSLDLKVEALDRSEDALANLGEQITPLVEAYNNAIIVKPPPQVRDLESANSDNHRMYAILNEAGDMFSCNVSDKMCMSSQSNCALTTWKKDPVDGRFYQYRAQSNTYCGNSWKHGTIKSGYHTNRSYVNEHMIAIGTKRNETARLVSDVQREKLLIQSRDMEWLVPFRKAFTDMVKGIDFLHNLDESSWDPRSMSYMRNEQYMTIDYSAAMLDYLVRNKVGTGFTDQSLNSLYLTLSTRYSQMPPWMFVTTILKHNLVKLDITLSVTATSDACTDNYKKEVGDHSKLKAIMSLTRGGTKYCERHPPDHPFTGWVDANETVLLYDINNTYITEPYSITNATAHGNIDHPYDEAGMKFEILHHQGCDVIGNYFRFQDAVRPADFEETHRRSVFCTFYSKFSTVNHKDPDNAAIATLRFWKDRENEREKRDQQKRMSHLALDIMGYLLYRDYGDNALKQLDAIHDDVVSSIKGNSIAISKEFDAYDTMYDWGITGVKGDVSRWIQRSHRYNCSLHEFYGKLKTEHTDELWVQYCWLVGTQYYINTGFDACFVNALMMHQDNSLDALQAYFEDIGGDKLPMRLQLLQTLRDRIPERKKVTTNTVTIKPHEIQKMKISKNGPTKGQPVDQYCRTVVSIIGQSYIDASPDLVNQYKKQIAHHPMLVSKDSVSLLSWDKEEITESGFIVQLPFTCHRDIIVAAAIDDSNSKDYARFATAIERYAKTRDDPYIGFSFGDDMIAHEPQRRMWHEADISANDGSYTDAYCRLSMYTSGINYRGYTNEAWSQRSRPYSLQSDTSKNKIVFRSVEGIGLPSGSATTTLQCTVASQSIHLGIALSGSRDWAQKHSGFDLSGLEKKSDSTAVGFLSNIISYEESDNSVHCVMHPGVLIRSFGFSKTNVHVIDKSFGKVKMAQHRAYISCASNLIAHCNTYLAMRIDNDFPDNFRGNKVLGRRYLSTCIMRDYYGVPTFVLALAKTLLDQFPKQFSTVLGATASMYNTLYYMSWEYATRRRNCVYDYSDWVVCSGYSQCDNTTLDMVEMVSLYLDFCDHLENKNQVQLYGAYFYHLFADYALAMRYGSLLTCPEPGK